MSLPEIEHVHPDPDAVAAADAAAAARGRVVPLLDDSTFLAARLAAAGVPTTLGVRAGCPHVFDTLSPALGVAYAARAVKAFGM